MRDINDRVGHYLFTLAVIYAGVAACCDGRAGGAGLSQRHHLGRPDGHRGLRAVHRLSGDHRGRRPGGVGHLRRLAAHHRRAGRPCSPFTSSRPTSSRRCSSADAAPSTPWRCSRPSPCSAGCGGRSAPSSRCRLLILISTIAAHLPSLRWLEILLADDRPVSERLARKPSLASVARPPRADARPSKKPRRRLATAK